MGMDGISMLGTGIVQEGNSRDVTSQTAQSVQQGNQEVKNINQLSGGNVIRDQEEREKGRQAAGENSESENEENVENPAENTEEEDTLNLKEYDPSEYENFYVKIVPESDTVELYDKITDALIETISAKDLSQLVSRLNIASGIFVNKRV
ncbi:hypothetical protein IJI31_05915 [bacterium]|nr:hypothetical protein [bacterium]